MRKTNTKEREVDVPPMREPTTLKRSTEVDDQNTNEF